jgi:hypothetical protein
MVPHGHKKLHSVDIYIKIYVDRNTTIDMGKYEYTHLDADMDKDLNAYCCVELHRFMYPFRCSNMNADKSWAACSLCLHEQGVEHKQILLRLYQCRTSSSS